MRKYASKTASLSAAIVVIFACGGGGADLSPEIAAHLAKYEELIQEFEPKFAAVRGDTPEFAKVADSYRNRTQAWMSEWETVAPDLSDEEGRAVKARIDSLNRRAERMLTG